MANRPFESGSLVDEVYGKGSSEHARLLMMDAMRPKRPSEANMKRDMVAKMMSHAYGPHLYAMDNLKILTQDEAEQLGVMAAAQMARAQPWFLTKHFAALYNTMIDGYDPVLNPPEPFERTPMFFTEAGAELFFPGRGGGEAVVITHTIRPGYETDEIKGEGLVIYADGGMTTFFMSDEGSAEMRELARRLFGIIWLTQQPELATVELQDHTRKLSRRERQAGKKSTVNKVHVVDLRHSVRVGVDNVAAATAAGEGDEVKGKRSFSSRWVVRGHWRNQRVGVGREEVRRTFVAPYVKGPDGAPLKEHVYKW